MTAVRILPKKLLLNVNTLAASPNMVISGNNHHEQVTFCLTESFLERKMTARKHPYDCRVIVTGDK
jgi:hypothetical protein